MESNQDLAYLLMYAAKIDNNISESEKEIILSKLGSEQSWKALLKTFEKEKDMTIANNVGNILQNASPAQKEEWLQEVKLLMQSDDEFSEVEQYLLQLLKKY